MIKGKRKGGGRGMGTAKKDQDPKYSGDEVATPIATKTFSQESFVFFVAATSRNAYNVHLHYYYSTIQNTYDTHNLE